MIDGKYEFLRVRREFRHPFITGAGSFNHIERIIIKTDVNGEVGFGEVAPWHNFNTETLSECLDVLNNFSGNLNSLTGHVRESVRRLPCLGAALSSCRHWSKIIKLNKKFHCAGLVSNLNADSFQEKISVGFKTIKIKISPASPISQISKIIQECPQDIRFRLDANGSLDLDQTNQWMERVNSLDGIEFIEQPLPVKHPGYGLLKSNKVALDESFIGPEKINWEGVIIIKPSLVGDWDDFLSWRKNRSNKFVFSSVFETAFGRQASLWLAQQDGSPHAVGFDTLNLFKEDGLDLHQNGPLISGLENFDWDKLWRKIK